MKVKIRGVIFDSTDEPIMLILDDEDKNLIGSMGDQTRYCSFPENTDTETVESFMRVVSCDTCEKQYTEQCPTNAVYCYALNHKPHWYPKGVEKEV